MSEYEVVDWKAPVVAAMVGALAVGAFVVYSIVSAPPDEAFARVDGSTQSSEATLFFVSTDLSASRSTPPPVEVAEWVVEGANEFSVTGFQYRGVDSPGNITVAAPSGRSVDATRRFEEARVDLEQAQVGYEALGEHRKLAQATASLSDLSRYQGDPD